MKNRSDRYKKIKTFTDLLPWRKGHELVLLVYKVTKDFPREERYSLTDQMRRAGISITSGIAEGFSRRTYKEKVQYYHIALGSLTELQNQLLLARDLGYLTGDDFDKLAGLIIEVHKLLNRLIKSTKKKGKDLNS